MPDNGKEILEAVNKLHDKFDEQQTAISNTNGKVDIMSQQMNTIEITVLKHEKIVYGNPEKMGAGGLLHKQGEQDNRMTSIENGIKGVKKEIKGLRGVFAILWSGIITTANVIINLVIRKSS